MNTVTAETLEAPRRTERACLFLQAPARPEQARRLRRAVTDFLAEHAWPDDDVDCIALAVGEACNNAVSYSPPESVVSVQAELYGPACVHIEIRNPGGGFVPDAARLGELPDDYAEHGRGFALMSALMDHVQVACEDGEIVVRLSKRRPS